MTMSPLRSALLAAANAIADAMEQPPPVALQPVQTERILTYDEVARRLGCHIQTARRRGKTGCWPECRSGGSVGVREADLDKYIRERSARGEQRRPIVRARYYRRG